MVKDLDIGNSKGYGFCLYQDPTIIDIACIALNGLQMGDKTLIVQCAIGNGKERPNQYIGFLEADLGNNKCFQYGITKWGYEASYEGAFPYLRS